MSQIHRTQSDHVRCDLLSRKTYAKNSVGTRAFWPSIDLTRTPWPLVLLVHVKEAVCHEFSQSLDSANYHRVERNIKKLLKTLKEGINNTANTNTNLMEIEKDCSCGFWKHVTLTVFQSSFLLFVTCEIILGRHICLIGSCDFVIHKMFFSYIVIKDTKLAF